jgi:hypothetical protein
MNNSGSGEFRLNREAAFYLMVESAAFEGMD